MNWPVMVAAERGILGLWSEAPIHAAPPSNRVIIRSAKRWFYWKGAGNPGNRQAMNTNSPGAERLIIYLDTKGPNDARLTLAFATAVLEELKAQGFEDFELARISPGSLTIECIALAGAAVTATGAVLTLAAAVLAVTEKIKEGREDVSYAATDLMDKTDAERIEFHVDVEVIVVYREEIAVTYVPRGPRMNQTKEFHTDPAASSAVNAPDKQYGQEDWLFEKRSDEFEQERAITFEMGLDFIALPLGKSNYEPQPAVSGILVNEDGKLGLIYDGGEFLPFAEPIGEIPIPDGAGVTVVGGYLYHVKPDEDPSDGQFFPKVIALSEGEFTPPAHNAE